VRARLRARARSVALTALSALPRTPQPGFRILVYHWVHDHERKSFAQHVAALARDFEPVSLSQGLERLRSGELLGRELAITFDDGFRSGLTNAAAALEQNGFRACFFLITDLVGAAPELVSRICRERLHLPGGLEPLSWEDVQRLLELGHEIGSHTCSHPDLAAMSPRERDSELYGSREELERRTGRAPAFFAVPYGDRARFSPVIGQAAREAGYSACLTAQRGRNLPSTDLYALRRDNASAAWPFRHVRYFLATG
jgi:peptidoglycan/xylan/chitin deacetylase (PgdA/CDA1 family)